MRTESALLTSAFLLLAAFLVSGCSEGLPEGAISTDECDCGNADHPDGEPFSIIASPDIPYGKHTNQKLDVYYSEAFVKAPIMIVVHGGGWQKGDKRTSKPFASFFNDLGFVVVAPDYRLSAEGYAFPAQVDDIACAVAWIKRNADRYGADKSKIILFGASAGSHITAMLAYDHERDWLEECDIRDESLGFAGFIGLSGVYDFDLMPEERYAELKPFLGGLFGPDRWQTAEPINFVTADDPPALLIHGYDDSYVNYQNSIAFAQELNKTGVYNVLDLIPSYKHTGPMTNFLTDEDIQKEVSDFLVAIDACGCD